MTDQDIRLERALAAGDPQSRDPMFRVEVLLRRERAALRRGLLAGGALAFAVALLATLGYGALAALVAPGATRLEIIAAAGVGLAAILASCVGIRPSLDGLLGRWRAVAGTQLWR